MSLNPTSFGGVHPYEVSVSGLLIDNTICDLHLSAVIKHRTSAGVKGYLSVNIKGRTNAVCNTVKLSSSIKNKLEALLCL